MKKIVTAVLIAVLIFSVLACSNTVAPSQPSVSEDAGVGAEATIAGDSSSPSPSASAVDTRPISPTTGKPGNGEYRPIQVQIDNEERTGRPQYGIQAADIVYEALIEGVDTRFSAIFNDTFPTKVGPVRSARVYFQYIQNEWDSIFVHDGGPYVAAWPKSYIYTEENGGDMKVRVDGGKGPPEDVFWHVSAEIAYANLQAAYDKYKYQQTKRSPMFQFDAEVDYSKYPDVDKAYIPFLSGKTNVEYRYDKANDNFVRYCYGDPFLDAETKQAVTVQNIIVQYAEIGKLAKGEGGRILIDLIGSGKAEFFVGGKHMTGTWERSVRKTGTTYKLDDGTELVLKPGNTWIEIQPDSQNILTEYVDGSTYPANGKITNGAYSGSSSDDEDDE